MITILYKFSIQNICSEVRQLILTLKLKQRMVKIFSQSGSDYGGGNRGNTFSRIAFSRIENTNKSGMCKVAEKRGVRVEEQMECAREVKEEAGNKICEEGTSHICHLTWQTQFLHWNWLVLIQTGKDGYLSLLNSKSSLKRCSVLRRKMRCYTSSLCWMIWIM